MSAEISGPSLPLPPDQTQEDRTANDAVVIEENDEYPPPVTEEDESLFLSCPNSALRSNGDNSNDYFLVAHLFSSPLFDENGNVSGQLQIVDEGNMLRSVMRNSRLKIHFRSSKATMSEINLKSSTAKVVHFSGHGSAVQGIAFEHPLQPFCAANFGKQCMVTREEIKNINHRFQPEIVFVSACHSETIGLEFCALGVPHVIAVKRYYLDTVFFFDFFFFAFSYPLHSPCL